MSALILIGPDGSGKSTLLAEYARRGYTTADVDHAVACSLGVPVADLFTTVAPAQRIELTAAIVRDLFDDIRREPQTLFILALPADYVDIPDVVAQFVTLKNDADLTVVVVEAGVSALMTRLGLYGPRVTNIVLPRKELKAQLEKRLPLYYQHADHRVDTTHESRENMACDVADGVIMLINPPASRS
ncbi:hypothetical protein JTE88_04275 [Arcanobacterium phocisimile]|uniref:Shikimate kinase n=1 Tax=Arcanobacterium phocisimile TaxID=1302235 RepID=A0ABX7IIX9_9ACTO|nr:hypothetical protein [Arcanobacterium phocisimile]QRV02941.1 hypothetical protein JTE88_04275 [Arcanobacterium phocisimile]